MGSTPDTRHTQNQVSHNYVENQETRDFINRVLKRDREETVNIIPKELARELLTPKKLEILETIQEEEVESMRDLARKLDRDPGIVKKDLDKLWKHGLIDYEEDGRKKKPVRTADKIVIEPF